jgi:competence protein ComEC
MNLKLFYFSILSFLLGVMFRSFIDLGFYFIILLGIISVSLLIWHGYLDVSGKKTFVFSLVVAIGVSFFIGALRFELSESRTSDDLLHSLVGERVSLEGVVSAEPKGKENYRSVTLEADTIYSLDGGGDIAQKINTKVLVFAPFYPEVSYGDRLSVTAELARPGTFETERGDVFDYAAYLAKDDIYFQVFYPEIEVISEGHGNFIVRNLLSVKHAFLEKVERVIPEPHAALLGGVLVGTEESLGERLIDDFRRTGLIHIVVLSGYNVTIVADFVRAIFATFLPGFLAGWFGIGAIILFAVIVGFGATVVRASIMAILVIIARQTHRHYEVGRALLVAGAMMVLVNPKILVFDASFQLSFLASLGLVYVVPVLERYAGKIPQRFGIREIVLATVATQILVLPFIIYKMGLFSIASLPVNLLALPAIPAIMLFGFITGVVGFFGEIISLPFAYISYALLEYVLRVVEFFSGFRLSAFEFGTFSFVWVIIAYTFYAFLIRRFSPGENKLHRLKEEERSDSEAFRIASEMEILEEKT